MSVVSYVLHLANIKNKLHLYQTIIDTIYDATLNPNQLKNTYQQLPHQYFTPNNRHSMNASYVLRTWIYRIFYVSVFLQIYCGMMNFSTAYCRTNITSYMVNSYECIIACRYLHMCYCLMSYKLVLVDETLHW